MNSILDPIIDTLKPEYRKGFVLYMHPDSHEKVGVMDKYRGHKIVLMLACPQDKIYFGANFIDVN